MSFYQYLVSWLWDLEEPVADEQLHHQKYLVCEQIKKSKVKLKEVSPKPVL